MIFLTTFSIGRLIYDLVDDSAWWIDAWIVITDEGDLEIDGIKYTKKNKLFMVIGNKSVSW